MVTGRRRNSSGRHAVGRERKFEQTDQRGISAGGIITHSSSVRVQCDFSDWLDIKCLFDMVIQAVGTGGDYCGGSNLYVDCRVAGVDYTCGNYEHPGDGGFDSGARKRC